MTKFLVLFVFIFMTSYLVKASYIIISPFLFARPINLFYAFLNETFIPYFKPFQWLIIKLVKLSAASMNYAIFEAILWLGSFPRIDNLSMVREHWLLVRECKIYDKVKPSSLLSSRFRYLNWFNFAIICSLRILIFWFPSSLFVNH